MWKSTYGEFDTTEFIASKAPGISFASCVRSDMALCVASSVHSSVLELSHLFLTSFLTVVCRQLPRLIRKARRLGEKCQKCVHLQLRDITVCCRFHPSRDEPVHVNFLWELADCYRTEPGTQCSASSVCPLSFWWSFDTGEEICSSVGFQARLDLERGGCFRRHRDIQSHRLLPTTSC